MGTDLIPDFLDDDQLKWYEQTSETLGKAKAQQEYPLTIEQVFLATNSSFFSVKTFQKLQEREPISYMAHSKGCLLYTSPSPRD